MKRVRYIIYIPLANPLVNQAMRVNLAMGTSPCRDIRVIYGKAGLRSSETSGYSFGDLPVISGYKWDYTFYKCGYKYL